MILSKGCTSVAHLEMCRLASVLLSSSYSQAIFQNLTPSLVLCHLELFSWLGFVGYKFYNPFALRSLWSLLTCILSFNLSREETIKLCPDSTFCWEISAHYPESTVMPYGIGAMVNVHRLEYWYFSTIASLSTFVSFLNGN